MKVPFNEIIHYKLSLQITEYNKQYLPPIDFILCWWLAGRNKFRSSIAENVAEVQSSNNFDEHTLTLVPPSPPVTTAVAVVLTALSGVPLVNKLNGLAHCWCLWPVFSNCHHARSQQASGCFVQPCPQCWPWKVLIWMLLTSPRGKRSLLNSDPVNIFLHTLLLVVSLKASNTAFFFLFLLIFSIHCWPGSPLLTTKVTAFIYTDKLGKPEATKFSCFFNIMVSFIGGVCQQVLKFSPYQALTSVWLICGLGNYWFGQHVGHRAWKTCCWMLEVKSFQTSDPDNPNLHALHGCLDLSRLSK